MTVWLATEIWPAQDAGPRIPWRHRPASGRAARRGLSKVGFHEGHSAIGPARLAGASGPPRGTRAPDDGRSEERRVGEEWVGTCSSRWWPCHKKKKRL